MEAWKKAVVAGSVGTSAILFAKKKWPAGVLATGVGIGGAGLGVPREIRKRTKRSARLFQKRHAFNGNDLSRRRKDCPTRRTWRPGCLRKRLRVRRTEFRNRIFSATRATRSQAAGERPDSIAPESKRDSKLHSRERSEYRATAPVSNAPDR